MPVAYDAGEVAYDLDATERGPWFMFHGRPGSYFVVTLSGTWEGTVKLVTKSPSGTVLDVADASWTENVGERQILSEGGREYAFDFARTSGTASCLAFTAGHTLDWTSAIRLEGMPGLALLETLKPITTE